MLQNPVKRKLKEGKAVVGTWLNLGDPIAAEALAALGFDWLVVDTEHSPIDLHAMATMFQAIGRFPVAPMVRIPWNSEENIKANDEIMVVLQIEHIDGVRKIDDILSVPDVDACFIGPNDLCASMGLPPSLEPSHKEFEEAVQTILRSAQRHGVPAGIHCATTDTVNRRIREGWRFVGIQGDLRFMLAAAKAARDAIKTE